MLDRYNDRWALITGASSGIGAEFASHLAARGMHVILAARRLDRLNELAQELNTRHGTNCHIVAVDLSQPQSAARLAAEVDRLGVELELLVNNAGVGMIGEIETTTPEEIRSMLTLNVQSLSELTYRFLPGMLSRGHGAVINVASQAAFQPVAFMSAYAASKSYVLHFTEALWAEARSRGVTVLATCPGVTRTDFFDTAGAPGWLEKHSSLTPAKVVRSTMKALEKRRQYVVPGWKNYLMTLLVRITTRRTAVNESKRYFRPATRRIEPTATDPSPTETASPSPDAADSDQ
ncbi:MAG: SDR family oxidoreductase [Planctomycetaceae bacterium]|nr:SDR family oxidoreductase [Planctomycetaceae bacterium]